MNWYVEVLKKYTVFNGRARRKEYWMFFLVNIIIMLGLDFIAWALPNQYGLFAYLCLLPAVLYPLAVLLPGLAVSVRRLHDTGRSGWWWLINLVPFIGFIVFLVFVVQDSQPRQDQIRS